MTNIAVRNLTKRFDDVVAVSNMDLNIQEGSFVALLGPSGCGKTTTLRCIAGFEDPNEGEIWFDNRDITFLPPEKRDVGMVFQNYALFPHMTVFDNISFGLEMRKVLKHEIRNRIEEVLSMVQLSGLEGRYPQQLSGGQQQRVALARALVIKPRVLLLDEPLANLDAKLREEMRFFIRSLQKSVGITTVYVTHDQAESMVIADKIVVMFDGVVNQIGAPAEIYNKPANRLVADFIGLINFIKGEVNSCKSGGLCRVSTALGEIVCKYEKPVAENSRVTLAVRPESIKLHGSDGELQAENAIESRVKERIYLGSMLDYKIVCRDDSVMRVQEDPWKTFEIGEKIYACFSSDRVWIIPEEQGGNLVRADAR
ncbi:MAG: ABC transporter ATP-binding protein [Deltaproteobacteria bacterium]|nr:ABC transporter ATP-binding protein [Deltaproteobacteria bacterium]